MTCYLLSGEKLSPTEAKEVPSVKPEVLLRLLREIITISSFFTNGRSVLYLIRAH